MQSRPEVVRADYIPKSHYISAEIVQLENERLWPRVWQPACRVEELENVGDFVRYDVAKQSVVIVRSSADTLMAFHNVCPHRGNELVTKPHGNIRSFYCSFHGWRFDLCGNNTYVKDHGDWAGCSDMELEKLGLSRVNVDTWGGFVFINMSPQAELLAEFLDPVPRYVDCIELDKMRYRRRVTVRLKAKWITGITSFMESYHVFTTHPQLKSFVDDISVSRAMGRHGNHGYPNARPFGAPSARTGWPVPDDLREGYARAMGAFTSPDELTGTVSVRSAAAAKRFLTGIPPGTPHHEVHRLGNEILREAALAEGAGWPTLTPEQATELGVVWNVFPNLSISVGMDAALIVRTRPDSLAVDSCLFDVYFLERYAPRKEPRPELERYPDWSSCEDKLPSLLIQDMRNIEQIQRGMNSVGFKGSRTNPIQEVQVSNLHQTLHQYLYGD